MRANNKQINVSGFSTKKDLSGSMSLIYAASQSWIKLDLPSYLPVDTRSNRRTRTAAATVEDRRDDPIDRLMDVLQIKVGP